MSLRSMSKLIYTAGVQTLLRLRGVNAVAALGQPTAAAARWRLVDALVSRRVPLLRQLLPRTVRALARSKFVLRPFAAIGHGFAGAQFHGASRRARRRWLHVAGARRRFVQRVQDCFAEGRRYNAAATDELPSGLHNYEFGKLALADSAAVDCCVRVVGEYIAQGCNAAVYALFRVDKRSTSREDPLAVKMMFNFDFSAPERVLLRHMSAELVPCRRGDVVATLSDGAFRPLPRAHPNIVCVHTAFVDVMPVLADAHRLYPEALPAADMFATLVETPLTMFLVMKRYRMTLREYVLTRRSSQRTRHVLLGQLLEAIVCVSDAQFAHRDLKSDNVLLSFDDEDEAPHLVLSDFGSALAAPLTMRYVDEFTDLGGNLLLRAPEISRATLTRGARLDFRAADLWAAGTLGVEILTGRNPFYAQLHTRTYADGDVDALARALDAPPSTCALVRRLLRIEPQQRPSPHVAASVACIALFDLPLHDEHAERAAQEATASCVLLERARAYVAMLCRAASESSEYVNKKLEQFTELYAAQTIAMHATRTTSAAERQLRATFLARVDTTQLHSAMRYFAERTDDEFGVY